MTEANESSDRQPRISRCPGTCVQPRATATSPLLYSISSDILTLLTRIDPSSNNERAHNAVDGSCRCCIQTGKYGLAPAPPRYKDRDQGKRVSCTLALNTYGLSLLELVHDPSNVDKHKHNKRERRSDPHKFR